MQESTMTALLLMRYLKMQVFNSNQMFFRIEIYRNPAFYAFLNGTF